MFLSHKNIKFNEKIQKLKIKKQCKVNFKKGNVGPSLFNDISPSIKALKHQKIIHFHPQASSSPSSLRKKSIFPAKNQVLGHSMHFFQRHSAFCRRYAALFKSTIYFSQGFATLFLYLLHFLKKRAMTPKHLSKGSQLQIKVSTSIYK